MDICVRVTRSTEQAFKSIERFATNYQPFKIIKNKEIIMALIGTHTQITTLKLFTRLYCERSK